MKLTSRVNNWFFSKIHQNKLIYNTCWEDPRCDRMLLDFQEDSKIVMITSAGCNALDYLLDNPKEIHCIDMNYRQNALLELKKTSFQQLEYEQFFAMFGTGASEQADNLYHKKLRSSLSDSAIKYWDKSIKYFSGKGLRKSFYYRGTSGLLAYSTIRLMRLKKQIRHNLNFLLQSSTLQEQQQYFAALEQMIFNRYVKAIVNNHYTMTLAGVPQNQQLLINQSYQGGTMEYLRDCFRKIFTTLDISDNYFYKVYLTGSYTKDCCPEYLKESNFETLTSRVSNIKNYTTTISDFLKKNPATYSHFVLLDHQDWLASNAPEALHEEWKLILKNSQPGTKILLRSAAREIDFFPDFVKERVEFDYQKAAVSHQLDRVGTYASVYLGVVK